MLKQGALLASFLMNKNMARILGNILTTVVLIFQGSLDGLNAPGHSHKDIAEFGKDSDHLVRDGEAIVTAVTSVPNIACSNSLKIWP